MPLAPDVGQKIKSEGSGPSQKTKPTPFRSEGNLHVTHYLLPVIPAPYSNGGFGSRTWDLGLGVASGISESD